MDIKLRARVRAYTKAREFNNIFSFLNSMPEEDGEYSLKLTINDGEKTFSWIRNDTER